MIRFECKFNADRTKQLNAFTMKKLWWLYLLFTVLFVAIGVINLLSDERDLVYAIVMIAIGVLFTPLCVCLTAVLQRKINKSMSIMSENTIQTFTFEEEYFTIHDEKGDEYNATTNARYSYFHKVISTSTSYLLYPSSQQCHIVPKDSLIQGTLNDLDAIFRRHLQGKFIVKK